ncbi:MAG: prepilin peptidase [Syntrophobacteraceae bacterium]
MFQSIDAWSLARQVWVFAAGCCLGSFFNVVIYRLPAGKSLVTPGSHCPGCGHAIAFYDNIPILSYLLLMGKCRYCRGRISIRYPAVEAITGLFALGLFLRYGWEAQFAIEFVFISLLILITFIDLDTYEIPNVLSLSGTVFGFLCSFATPRLSWTDSLLGILIGGGSFYAIAALFQYLRKKEGMGMGDVKLLGMIGAFLGLPGVLLTIMVSSIVGTLAGLPVMWRSREGMSTRIPFGPFLAIGAICYLFWGPAFIQWYLSDFWGA